jgi:hypothetical protein
MVLAIPHVGRDFASVSSEPFVIRTIRIDQHVFSVAIGTHDYILLCSSQVQTVELVLVPFRKWAAIDQRRHSSVTLTLSWVCEGVIAK